MDSISKTASIHPSVCIGEIGFGYKRDKNGELILREHKFGVVIYGDVDIRSNCSIHTGRWRDTVIGQGTKIDSHVLVAHNVQIGKHCIIGSGAKIMGSVTIGDYTEIWGNAVIKQGVKIGKHCVVGACTFVRHDVPDNTTIYDKKETFISTIT